MGSQVCKILLFGYQSTGAHKFVSFAMDLVKLKSRARVRSLI